MKLLLYAIIKKKYYFQNKLIMYLKKYILNKINK